MTARRHRLRRPAMVVLAACFGLSAMTRVFDPTGAIAYEVQKRATAAPAAPKAAMPGPAELEEMIRSLREREEQLDRRAAAIAEKSKVVEAAEARLREELARLETVEQRLADLLRLADEATERDIAKLVAAYQAMGGKKAAPIFEEMDSAFAAGLLSRMDDGPAADILGLLSPEKAYAVTILIASQNARAPSE